MDQASELLFSSKAVPSIVGGVTILKVKIQNLKLFYVPILEKQT
jgi:hypothetical protein